MKKSNGTLLIITGDGKGKTTSALGMVARTLGHDGKVFIIQFIKKDVTKLGEFKFFNSLGIEWESYGDGFTWKKESLSKTRELCERGWLKFKEIVEDSYDLIVLDEFTYLLSLKLIDKQEVLTFFRELKLRDNYPNIIVTGRDADKDLIEIFDCVSNIQNIKHHYESKSQNAKEMIEY